VDSVEGRVDVEAEAVVVVVEGATAVDEMSELEAVVAVVVDSPRLPGTEVAVEVEAALEAVVVDSEVDTAVVLEVAVAVPVGGRQRVCPDGIRRIGHV